MSGRPGPFEDLYIVKLPQFLVCKALSPAPFSSQSTKSKVGNVQSGLSLQEELTPLMVVSSWLPIKMESPPAAGAGVPTAAVAGARVGAAAGAVEAGAGVLQRQ